MLVHDAIKTQTAMDADNKNGILNLTTNPYFIK